MESERACLEQDTGNRQQEKSSKQQETRATKQVHMSSLSAAYVTLNCCSGMHGYSKGGYLRSNLLKVLLWFINLKNGWVTSGYFHAYFSILFKVTFSVISASWCTSKLFHLAPLSANLQSPKKIFIICCSGKFLAELELAAFAAKLFHAYHLWFRGAWSKATGNRTPPL